MRRPATFLRSAQAHRPLFRACGLVCLFFAMAGHAAHISDTVYDDANGNGVRDVGETALGGVTVTLYSDANGNGVLDAGEEQAAQTVADGAGAFSFSDPAAGDFVVEVSNTASARPALEGRSSVSARDVPPSERATLKRVWRNRKQYFINSIHSNLTAQDPYVLYNTQLYNNNLLRYAAAAGDAAILDELAEMAFTSYAYLQERTQYVYYYWPGYARESVHDLETPAKMWTGNPASTTNGALGAEVTLVSSQWLYFVSNLVNRILDLPVGERTANMNALLTQFVPVILTDHYQRWVFAGQGIFQVKGWGGEAGIYNHYDFIGNKLNRFFGSTQDDPVSYLNAVTDTDMWISAGVVEMLSAHEKDATLVPLAAQQRTDFLAYVARMAAYVEDRLSDKALTDLNSQPVTGVNVDLGAWDDHADRDYSGYTTEESPLGLPENPAPDTGWDISHARRFVQFFETCYRHRGVTGLTFPTSTTMTGLANQFAYGAFNKDLNAPLATNYMDGANGWYRVGYHGDTDPGYAPFGLTGALVTAGYGFWSEFCAGIPLARDAIYAKINALYSADVSGNNRDLFLSSGAWAADNPGNGTVGGSWYFDGVADYLDMRVGLPDTLAATGSVQFWFKPVEAALNEDLINIYENSYNDFLLIRRTSLDKILVLIEDENSAVLSVTTSATVNVGQWNHVAVTQDGGGVAVYVNGTLSDLSGVNSAAWIDHLTLNGAWLGRGHWSKFKGYMDDVQVWDRALALAEVGAHEANASLLARWEFAAAPDATAQAFMAEYYAVDCNKRDSMDLLMFLPTFLENQARAAVSVTRSGTLTGFNFVALTLSDSGVETAQALCEAVPNALAVWKWDAENQSWSGHPAGGPNNFAVAAGNAYLVAVSGAGEAGFTGTWADPTFDLKTGFNLIYLPPSQSGLADAEALAQAIPHCAAVWRWNAAGQGWSGHPAGGPNRFDLSVGEAYLVYVTEASSFN